MQSGQPSGDGRAAPPPDPHARVVVVQRDGSKCQPLDGAEGERVGDVPKSPCGHTHCGHLGGSETMACITRTLL